MVPSQVVIRTPRYDGTTSSDPQALSAALPKPLAPFVGPGRLVHKFNTYVGGKVADGCSKVVTLLKLDPSGRYASCIEKFFGSSPEERQSQLDLLYDLLSDRSIETQATNLKKNCLMLLNYAWPQSSSETTQWAVFDTIIVLTTRYPGIRNIFCMHKNVPDPFDHVQISKNWLREGHTSGPEFDFYREFASFCLYKSRVVEIVERSRPSDLARIECVAANAGDEPCLNPVPIEELLGHCLDGPEFNFEKLSAIRYLATILQLPAFWLHDINNNRLADILFNICNTICRLIEDTDSDDRSAETMNVWIRVALNSIDNMAHALLIGIMRFMPRLPTLPSLLSKLCRPDVMTRFPLSSPMASEIKSCLQSGSAQNADSTATPALEQAPPVTQTSDMGTEGSINQSIQSEDINPSHDMNEYEDKNISPPDASSVPLSSKPDLQEYNDLEFSVSHSNSHEQVQDSFGQTNDLPMSILQNTQGGLRLLSLDGGISGLSSLIILRHIMYRIQQKHNLPRIPLPCEYFSLMAGTNTGGLIVLMLGRLGMSVDEAILAYQALTEMVFAHPRSTTGKARFSAKGLEEAVKSVIRGRLGDADAKLLHPNMCKTFVCARNSLNMSAGIPVLFRTYISPDHPNFDGTIWEAARATSATPTFFKSVKIGTQTYIGGGIGHNNPTQLVLEEAKHIFPNQPFSLVLSIGTGRSDTISLPKPSLFQRKIMPINVIKVIEQIATDCEATHQDVLRRFENDPGVYFRFSAEQGPQNVSLSGWEKLPNVEAHTKVFLGREEVKKQLNLAVGFDDRAAA